MTTNNHSGWVPPLSDDEDFVTVSKEDFIDGPPHLRAPDTGSVEPAKTPSDSSTWIFFTDPSNSSRVLPGASDGADISDKSRLRLRDHVPPRGTSLNAVYPGVKPFLPRLLVREQAPLPYDAVPRLYLPLTGEPGICDAVAAAPTMYGHLLRRSPIPSRKLVGYKPTEKKVVTESRRFHVTRYYTEMLRADFGRIEAEGSPWRSARLMARGEDLAPPSRSGRHVHSMTDNDLLCATLH